MFSGQFKLTLIYLNGLQMQFGEKTEFLVKPWISGSLLKSNDPLENIFSETYKNRTE